MYRNHCLKEPVEFAVNDTVPVGDEPDIVVRTVVELLRLTDDGVSVTRVVVVDLVTVRVDWPRACCVVCITTIVCSDNTEPPAVGVNVTEHFAVN